MKHLQFQNSQIRRQDTLHMVQAILRQPQPADSYSIVVQDSSGNLVDDNLQEEEEPSNYIIHRNAPVIDSKYKEVWQRAMLKIRTNKIMDRFRMEMNLFGTTADIEELGMQDEVDKLIHRRQNSVKEHSGKVLIPKGLISLDSPFKNTWQVVLILLLIYTATIMPYRMAFVEPVMWDNWFYVELCIDFLFFVDILVNMNSVYQRKDGSLEVRRAAIFCNYLKGWLLLDVIACIPFSLIQSFIGDPSDGSETKGEYATLLRLVRLPRLYRLLRLTRIFKMFKCNKRSLTMMKIQSFLRLNHSLIRLVMVMISAMVFAHIVACALYFWPNINGFDEDSWVVRGGFIDDEPSSIYITALYWCYTTISVVGYGDINSRASEERFLSIWLMLFGVAFFSFIVGSISSIFERLNFKEIKLQEKFSMIDQFVKECEVDIDFKIRLYDAVQYQSTKGSSAIRQYTDIFNELPKVLRYEVAVAMHSGAVQFIPFFAGRDKIFICKIVPFLTHLKVRAAEYVYVREEHADEIYFIVSGRANYVFMEDDIAFKSHNRGQYFGDIEVIQQIPRKYTVKAVKRLEVLVLNRSLWKAIQADFKSIATEMTEVASIRDKIMDKQMRTITKERNLNPSDLTNENKSKKKQKEADPFLSEQNEKIAKIEETVANLADNMQQYMTTSEVQMEELERMFGRICDSLCENSQQNSISQPTVVISQPTVVISQPTVVKENNLMEDSKSDQDGEGDKD